MGNLPTPKSVQKLQTALHAKAKAEAGYRFYDDLVILCKKGNPMRPYNKCARS